MATFLIQRLFFGAEKPPSNSPRPAATRHSPQGVFRKGSELTEAWQQGFWRFTGGKHKGCFLRTHGVDMTSILLEHVVTKMVSSTTWNCQLSGKVGKPSAISYRPNEGYFSDAIHCWIIWRHFRGHFIGSFRPFGFRSIWTWAFFPNIDQRFAKQRWRWHFGPPLYMVRDFSICALSKFYIMTYHDEPLDLIPKVFLIVKKEPEFHHYGSSILHFFPFSCVFFVWGVRQRWKKHLNDAFRR